MTELEREERAANGIVNRVMLKLSGLLGLTTGIGVVVWGVWSLLATVGMTIYERTGLPVEQIVIEDAFNQGLLQSAMLIALGAVILELRRINEALHDNGRND